MERVFKVGLLIGIAAIAFALFLSSQNGRYQYSTDGSKAVVLDTRTGEFWLEDGSYFNPRLARITVHHPLVEDESASDDRSQAFHDCLMANIEAVRTNAPKRDCLAERSHTAK